MVKLTLIIRMVKTTRNFWQALSLKTGKGKKRIVFRNGIIMEVDWTGYRKMRDLFQYLSDHKFKVQKAGQEFVIKKKTPSFNCSVPLVEQLPLFDILLSFANQNRNILQIDDSSFRVGNTSSSFQIHILDEKLFAVKSELNSWIGPVDSLRVYFFECERGVYDCQYDGRTVLDVGGFCGETAVFFASRGAKKVIIYEPVEAHHDLILKNIAMNNINAELHMEGIGEENGNLDVNYEVADWGFGPLSKGKKTVTIKTRSALDIISHSKADVAKIDCEGAEVSLVGVPQEILKTIGFYIIETHTKAIRHAITEKFTQSGFTQAREPEHLSGDTFVLYFKRNQIQT